MTVSKKSTRYKNNVGGCQYLLLHRENAIKHDLMQFRYIKGFWTKDGKKNAQKRVTILKAL